MEEALLKIPAVRYAAVIGQPDGERGELVKAVVTLKEGESSDSESLLQLCIAQLTGQPAPDRLEIISEMPMTATGKIGRAVLQARERVTD